MDTKTYPVTVSILLKPVGEPRCKITLGQQLLDLTLIEEQWITLHYQGHGSTRLTIEHYGKAELDPSTAVIIEKIDFDLMSNPKFAWAGLYYPTYPKHVVGDNELKYHTYLGWNGIWVLDFTLPIYTWIHQIEGLGWIYD
jgi:hypothetical protein